MMKLHEIRYLICTECEHFNQSTKLCGKCKCFMPAKVRVRWARCPINKWLAVTKSMEKSCAGCNKAANENFVHGHGVINIKDVTRETPSSGSGDSQG